MAVRTPYILFEQDFTPDNPSGFEDVSEAFTIRDEEWLDLGVANGTYPWRLEDVSWDPDYGAWGRMRIEIWPAWDYEEADHHPDNSEDCLSVELYLSPDGATKGTSLSVPAAGGTLYIEAAAADLPTTPNCFVVVSADGDDVSLNTTDETLQDGTNTVHFGNDSDGDKWDALFRFASVPIPAHAVIQSARLRCVVGDKGGTNDNGSVDVVVAAQKEADAGQVGSYAAYDALTWTDNSVVWSILETWEAEHAYHSPDLAEIVQELVEQSGWANNQAMGFALKYQAGLYERGARAHDWAPDSTVMLEVRWAPPPAAPWWAYDSQQYQRGRLV
ncbi:MAG: hypothetical protein ACOC7S_00835 [Planctomycetota bacterium]